MTTVEVRPALRQAAALFTLAQHLTANPGLCPVNITFGYQLKSSKSPAGRRAADLVAWAESLRESRVTVSDLDAEAFVYVTGVMTSGRVTVWAVVPNLLTWLGLERDAHCVPIGLESLREFAVATGQTEGR